MRKSDSDDILIAANATELLEALKVKASVILITKEYRSEFLKNTELPLGEESLFSYTAGAAVVGVNPIFLLMNRFSKEDKQQRKIDSKVQRYVLKEHGPDLLLRLRQLDY